MTDRWNGPSGRRAAVGLLLVVVTFVGAVATGQSRLLAALAAIATVPLALAVLSPALVDDGSVGVEPVRYAVPGDGFAARLSTVSGADRPRGDTASREWIRDRVAAVAATLPADTPEETAAFLDGDLLPARGPVDGVRELLTGVTRFRRRVADAVDALYRERYGDTPAGTVGTGGDADVRALAPAPMVGATVGVDVRPTGRWRPIGALALAFAGLGVGTGSRAALLASGVCACFVGFGRLGTRAEPSLAVERTFSTADPRPGDRVTVSLRVRNRSGRLLPAVHVRDPVPPGLSVVDGDPERLAPLRAGATARLTYEVRAVRGAHEFEAPVVTVESLPGSREWTCRPAAPGRLTVVPRLDDGGGSVTDAGAVLRPGPTRTPDAGAGTTFHSVREYHPGDPLSRVDWKGLARSGDLRTVSFHRERSVSAVLVVDARRPAYCAPTATGRPSVDRSVAAARRLAGSLFEDGHRVGLAALSPRDCWLPPGSGPDHAARLRRRLALAPALSWRPPDELGHRGLRDRLVGADLVVLCSPLVDDRPVAFAEAVAALGPAVSVVAPDPTAADTPARRFGRLDRERRVTDLRRSGLGVVTWARDEPLRAALERATAEGVT